MGDEILTSEFSEQDYQAYRQRLQQETELLADMFRDQCFSYDEAMGGFEQEAWLVNTSRKPSPDNELLLNTLPPDVISPELSRFNFELNVTPRNLDGDGLHLMHDELLATWRDCVSAARQQQDEVVMIGILPTVNDGDLTLENMSPLNRYRALNEQVMRSRKGLPLHLDIVGKQHLRSTHNDVMLESAATSFQIHRQIPAAKSKRYFNASMIASAACVAVGANSPFLFERELWEETRIPLFESAVETGGYGDAASGPVKRVSFGSGYVNRDIFECFAENLEHFPVLLPVELDEPAERLPYLRLHNGTIWRWNRPLIGIDEGNRGHLRIEQRVVSAGPTIVDEMANAAFFYGLHEQLATMETPPELLLPFAQARDNFYHASRLGLQATNVWFNDKRMHLNKLIQETLLDMAHRGLERLNMNRDIREYYLGIIEQRVACGQTGAQWQRVFVARYGNDMQALTSAYLERQESERPVHEWKI